jgi:hypothetical protein
MWLYLGPSSRDCNFSEELREADISIRIHKVLDHGDNLDPGASPAP